MGTESPLSRLKHFGELPGGLQQAILAAGSLRRFAEGQVIYVEGEAADTVYILMAGWVRATRMNREGREQAMMFLQPVELFGDIGVLTSSAYPGTAVALEAVEAWAIPAERFLDLVKRHSELALAVIRHLGERVLYYTALVEDLSLRSVEARLANTLLRHAEVRDGQLIVPRRDWTTFDEMAIRLGTVRDVLSRALKTLEAENLLKVEKQAVILLDPKGLAKRGDS